MLRLIENKPRRREDDRRRSSLGRRPRKRRRPFLTRGNYGILALALAALVCGLYVWLPGLGPFRLASATLFGPGEAVARHFPLCRSSRITCVVDGDTFWLDGVKIRLADINTPEVSEPLCAAEAALGARATRRLQLLLNAGPFELTRGLRDEDRYGRKLRIVQRDGRSIGDVLIEEGLARRWLGYKQSWCG